MVLSPILGDRSDGVASISNELAPIDTIFSVSHLRMQSATFVMIECRADAPIRDSTALNPIAIVHPPVAN